MLGVKRYKVALVPHDYEWENHYKITERELKTILGDNLIKICHVGSTAIKGIVAKPILDVAVVIKDEKLLNIEGMEAVGYDYCGDRDVPGRYLFVRRVDGDISTHHIHCYLSETDNYKSTVSFCKYLNDNPEYAKQYNDLKVELASKFPDDRVAYTDAKAAFINHIIELAKTNNNN